MPKIELKPNSPEFADPNEKSVKVRLCDMPGCSDQAEFKAPKHRGLNEYHHFCLEHIREYNKAWNFFEGMSPKDVEDHMLKSIYGDRPTWKYGVNAGADAYEDLFRAAQDFYGTKENTGEANGQHHYRPDQTTPEFEAMAVMGLKPPLTLDGIKNQYKILVKKYHPDLNKGDKESEDRLKSINMAYTILKVAYEKFEDLPQK
jgi:DnaJ-domain-containing protein 1